MLISLWCGVCVRVVSTFIAHIWKLSGLWIQQLQSAEFWTWIIYGRGTVYWEQVICFIAYISNSFIYFPRSFWAPKSLQPKKKGSVRGLFYVFLKTGVLTPMTAFQLLSHPRRSLYRVDSECRCFWLHSPQPVNKLRAFTDLWEPALQWHPCWPWCQGTRILVTALSVANHVSWGKSFSVCFGFLSEYLTLPALWGCCKMN